MIKRYCQTPAPGEEEIIEDILTAADLLYLADTPGTAVELGANDGEWLSNTKFLEEQFGFTRYLFDRGGKGNPKVIQVEITPDNIMNIFAANSVPQEPTVLCIDIDGNDYWVRKAITLRPALIVMEYNGSLEPTEARTIPYTPDFVWEEDGYYGASLAAMKQVNVEAGYKYICQCGSLNCFFIRDDLANSKMPWNNKTPGKVTPGYTRRQDWLTL